MALISDSIYQHFRGGVYEVLLVTKGCGSNIEDECVIVYYDIQHPELGIFSRTATDFLARVKPVAESPTRELEEGTVPRFTALSKDDFQEEDIIFTNRRRQQVLSLLQ